MLTTSSTGTGGAAADVGAATSAGALAPLEFPEGASRGSGAPLSTWPRVLLSILDAEPFVPDPSDAIELVCPPPVLLTTPGPAGAADDLGLGELGEPGELDGWLGEPDGWLGDGAADPLADSAAEAPAEEEPASAGAATATPCPVATAAPTPSATAKPPTRPT